MTNEEVTIVTDNIFADADRIRENAIKMKEAKQVIRNEKYRNYHRNYERQRKMDIDNPDVSELVDDPKADQKQMSSFVWILVIVLIGGIIFYFMKNNSRGYEEDGIRIA